MTRWEYRTVDLGRVKERKLDREMTALGAEGWELVSVFGKSGNLLGGLTKAVAVFKRPTSA